MAELQSSATSALVLQLLGWVAASPRTYGETMEAWRTSCPRLPVWEDAVDDRLVEVLPAGGAGMARARVRLTSRGETHLTEGAGQ